MLHHVSLPKELGEEVLVLVTYFFEILSLGAGPRQMEAGSKGQRQMLRDLG